MAAIERRRVFVFSFSWRAGRACVSVSHSEQIRKRHMCRVRISKSEFTTVVSSDLQIRVDQLDKFGFPNPRGAHVHCSDFQKLRTRSFSKSAFVTGDKFG